MAKHSITINIVSKQSKDEEKRDKLDNAVGKKDNSGSNPSDNLRKKKANKSGKSSSAKSKSGDMKGTSSGQTTGGGSTGNSSGSSSGGNGAAYGVAAGIGAVKLVHTAASTAINLTGSVGDYTVEANRIKSVQNLGNKVGSIAAKSAASGPAWWVTLIFELANWGVEMAENNIQWNHQQQMNTIQAERASNRLGIVSTAGNRNMKL